MFGLLKFFLQRWIKKGNLSVTDSKGQIFPYGDGNGVPVHIKITSTQWECAILIDPSFQLGNAYMNGGLIFLEGDIFTLLEIIFTNIGPNSNKIFLHRGFYGLRKLTKRLTQQNNLERSSKNIRHHYDFTAQFYEYFLDPDRQYSCAYFERSNMDLAEAQLAKKRHLAAKLYATQGQSILDLGCGWGGLGLYLARFLEVNVTGVTLSHEQYTIANQRAKEEGLQERCTFLLQDYRLLEHSFDRIVSVGMFEHVGIGYYKEYFSYIKKLLKPNGIFILHSIGRNSVPGITNPFIRNYIFPGGYIPALSEVFPILEKSGLIITDLEILRLHYAFTLKKWRQAFMNHIHEIRSLYDERFCRMWEFYLAASESAFLWQNMMVFQIQIAHQQDAVPLTRDYVASMENQLRQKESSLFTSKSKILK